MATTTYNPNDTNCTGWKGDYTDTADDEEYDSITPNEKDVVSTDDANSIDYYAGEGHQTFHRYEIRVQEAEGNVTQIDLSVRCTTGTADAKKLGIYDDNGSTWDDTLDSDSGAGLVTLTKTITANPGYYIDATGNLKFRVFDDPSAGGTLDVEYAECVITYFTGATRTYTLV